ncbi:MAG: TetR/AcrR family transcriptional regulator [Actinobacteria bacterium]|nr:TetR/AcrR family transcriptional regulator [Actinomycetota bacterium]
MARGDRREELLDAAEGVVEDEGVAGLTIDRVAARAGVAKGTVYLYFASKEQLVGALKARCLEEMTAMVVAGLADLESGDWWGTADAVVEAVIDYDLSHRWVIAVMATETGDEESKQVYREATGQMLDLLIAAIRQGAAEGVFEVDDPETTATLLYFALEGTLHHTILYEADVDRDRLVSSARALIHRALGDD